MCSSRWQAIFSWPDPSPLVGHSGGELEGGASVGRGEDPAETRCEILALGVAPTIPRRFLA
jgi:hypothetical protein